MILFMPIYFASTFYIIFNITFSSEIHRGIFLKLIKISFISDNFWNCVHISLAIGKCIKWFFFIQIGLNYNTLPHSTLNKKSHARCYHFIKWCKHFFCLLRRYLEYYCLITFLSIHTKNIWQIFDEIILQIWFRFASFTQQMHITIYKYNVLPHQDTEICSPQLGGIH